MTHILVKHIDQVYCKVLCADNGIEYELYDFFSFKAPGAEWDPRVRAGKWDGYTRLYSRKTKKLYAGLVSVLYEFARMNKYKIEVDKALIAFNPINREEMEKFLLEEFNPHSKGKPIIPYEYQFDAVEHAIKFNRATLLAATSAGKSLIIYLLTRYYELLEDIEDKRILICVPTTGLVEQLYADFDDYSTYEGSDWNVYRHAQKISGKYSKYLNSKIVISTWQSIYKNGSEYFDQFGAVIVDETHTAQAASLRGILGNMPNIKYRVGLTGTLDESQSNKLIISGLLGPVKRIVKTHQLQSDGRAADVEINMLMLQHRKDTRALLQESKKKFGKGKVFEAELQTIINCEERNDFILRMVKNLSGNTLVLFDRVDSHGKLLYERCRDMKKDVYLIAGEVSPDEREKIRNMCEHLDNATIWASSQTMSTGVSIKKLHNLIFISTNKSKIRVLQSVGRLLRLHDSKDIAKVIDLTDDLTWEGKENYAIKHAMKRAEFYIKEKWKIKFRKIPI